jgi:ubiquitin carboxyl-terminal hydrolase 48
MTLNMSKYFSEDCKENTVYTLCAVLVHRGSSAHSGHYIAHIKDRKTGSWFKFNDEKVEQTEENVLKLCTEDVNEEGADTKDDIKQIVKFTKGSSDPYMLVYKNASLDDQSK